MKDMDNVAAIDIGSNAIRFLIYNIGDDTEIKKSHKVAFVRAPIRLGEDVFSSGEISQRRRELFSEAMQGFSHLMKAFCVKKYRACATSAMREAKNGREVIAEAKESSGIDVEIISGQEEAQLIYDASGLSDNPLARTTVNIDVGGGSTEVVLQSDGKILDAQSFPLGTVRSLKKAIKDEDKEAYKAHMKSIGERFPEIAIIGSGGNINRAAELLSKRDGEVIAYVELKMLYDMLKKMSFEDRVRSFKLNPYRADVIIPALKIFLMASKRCNGAPIIVPQVGLTDGLIKQFIKERG